MGRGFLNLCSEMFEKIYISQSVYDEVEQSGMSSLVARIEELTRFSFRGARNELGHMRHFSTKNS